MFRLVFYSRIPRVRAHVRRTVMGNVSDKMPYVTRISQTLCVQGAYHVSVRQWISIGEEVTAPLPAADRENKPLHKLMATGSKQNVVLCMSC